MINMSRKGIKFSIQGVYFPQSYFESRHYGKRFNSIGKFKSLTFQLRAIYFHTFAVDMSVYFVFCLHSSHYIISSLNPQNLRNIIKKVAKISIIQIDIELIRLSVKTTVFCYFLRLFRYPINFAHLR